jgi:hypothetical protein
MRFFAQYLKIQHEAPLRLHFRCLFTTDVGRNLAVRTAFGLEERAIGRACKRFFEEIKSSMRAVFML